MSLIERNKIAPQMEDYDRIGAQWVPYLMSFHTPSVQLSSVSTDAGGFRKTTGRDGETRLTYERFADASDEMPRGVVLGGSAAFGVGATHDRHTIPSVLNRRTGALWFNFGGRAFNSTQEMLLFLLYLPRKIRTLLLFSGINNLTLSYLASDTSPVYNSFFYQSVFARAMESPPDLVFGVRRSLRLLMRELRYKVWPPGDAQIHHRIDLQYANILTCFERDLGILKALGKTHGFETYFAFQPIATWIRKDLTPEETRIFEILDRLGKDWVVLADYITSQREKYIGDVRQICNRLDVAFCDLNAAAEFAASDWLFVDRVHLTDRGYALAAEILQGAFGL